MDTNVLFDELVGGASETCPAELGPEEAMVGTIQGMVDFTPCNEWFSAEAKIVFIYLQVLEMPVSQQRSRLTILVDIYCQLSGMEKPLLQQQIDNIVA